GPEHMQKFGAHSCRYCDSPVTVHQSINPGHCGAKPCFERHVVAGIQKRSEAHIKERSRKRAVAKAQTLAARTLAAEWMEVEVDEVRVASVPHQSNPVVALPNDRRDAFLSHLSAILGTEDSSDYDTPDTTATPVTPLPSSAPEPVDLASAACSACQGKCCAKGGGTTYAFLTPESVADQRAARPQMRLEDIRAVYVKALPAASVSGSCVYHGERGCTLERDWRAPICNSFLCSSITALGEVVDPDDAQPLALVALENDVAQKVVAFSRKTGGRTFPIGNMAPECKAKAESSTR
ncbi:MAG: hypothetical protein WBB25_23030, partial [Sulfitobacter sp.]